MPPIVVFDVNETLLDLSALDAQFEANFGSGRARIEWFGELLQLAFVSSITGAYADFSQIARAALGVMEERYGTTLSENHIARISQRMKCLPAHPDAKEAMSLLRANGVRLVALTNSTAEAAEEQLVNAGLRSFLDRVFSADSVRRLKPAAEPYFMVARELAVPASSLLMVTVHAWDLAGAARTGWRAAFIRRPGHLLDPLAPQPAFCARDLQDFAGQVLQSAAKP